MKKVFLIAALSLFPFLAQASDKPEVSLQVLSSPEKSPFEVNAQARGSYNFGAVPVGRGVSTDFVLSSRGPGILRVYGVNVFGMWYSGATNCPAYLYPGERCVIRANYWPRDAGQHFGRLDVNMSVDYLSVDLFGQAYY